jgi:hypothetical protein
MEMALFCRRRQYVPKWNSLNPEPICLARRVAGMVASSYSWVHASNFWWRL